MAMAFRTGCEQGSYCGGIKQSRSTCSLLAAHRKLHPMPCRRLFQSAVDIETFKTSLNQTRTGTIVCMENTTQKSIHNAFVAQEWNQVFTRNQTHLGCWAWPWSNASHQWYSPKLPTVRRLFTSQCFLFGPIRYSKSTSSNPRST
jgi:hypothetical protein